MLSIKGTPKHSSTAFRADLGEDNLSQLRINWDRIQRSTTSEADYQKAVGNLVCARIHRGRSSSGYAATISTIWPSAGTVWICDHSQSGPKCPHIVASCPLGLVGDRDSPFGPYTSGNAGGVSLLARVPHGLDRSLSTLLSGR